MKSENATITKFNESCGGHSCSSLFYVEAVALAICKFAENSQSFKAWLCHMLTESNIKPLASRGKCYKDINVDLLAPPNEKVAAFRAMWLLDQMSNTALPGIVQATEILSDLLEEAKDEPQCHLSVIPIPSFDPEGALPLGTRGIFITGLIVGKMNQIIIVRPDLYSHPSALTQYSTQASAGVIAKALENTQMNATRLEPEVAAWLFGDREIQLFASTKLIGLEEMVVELERLDMIYSTSMDESGIAALAISPAFTGSYQMFTWRLEPLA